jgi:hypothetical protein
MEDEGARVFRRRGDLLHQLLGLGDQLVVFVPRFLFFVFFSPPLSLSLRLLRRRLSLGLRLVRLFVHGRLHTLSIEMSDMYTDVYIYEEMVARMKGI